MEALAAEKYSLLKAFKLHNCIKDPIKSPEKNFLFKAQNLQAGVLDRETSSKKCSLDDPIKLDDYAEECVDLAVISTLNKSMDQRDCVEINITNSEKNLSGETRTGSRTPEDNGGLSAKHHPDMIDRLFDQSTVNDSKQTEDKPNHSEEMDSPILKLFTDQIEERPKDETNTLLKELVNDT